MQGLPGDTLPPTARLTMQGFCYGLLYHLPRGLPCRVLPGATLPPTAKLTMQGFAGGASAPPSFLHHLSPNAALRAR